MLAAAHADDFISTTCPATTSLRISRAIDGEARFVLQHSGNTEDLRASAVIAWGKPDLPPAEAVRG
jgi:hypothetical protein